MSENDEVRDGNEQMAASEASAALRHYDQAARRLPNDPGVHLNRGLALMESGELDRAREALSLAAQPPASREIRADAHYDLGLTFYRQADEAAGTEDHEEAQRLFREAADSFRRSLRLRPGNGDAGWNLELALRRLREQEEQQEQEQQEQEEQEESEGDEAEDQSGGDEPEEPSEGEDQEGQDQEGQDQEGQDQEGQDQESQDQEGQDQEGQDQEGQDQAGQDQEGQPDPEAEGSDSSDGEDGSPEQPAQDDPGSSEGREAEEQPSTSGTQGDSMAPEHRRVLDALEDGEDNLERHRAAARAARERRRVEQDW